MTKVRTSQLAPTGAVAGQALVYNGSLWLPGAYDDTTKIPKALVDAKGDLIAGSAADTVVRVPIGANNQVLTASSTAAGGMTWAAPNDTTKVALATLVERGDLIVAPQGGVAQRLPVGANGRVLTADDTAAQGVRWLPPDVPEASEITFVPFGTVSATNVQAAIEELSVEGGSSSGGGAGGGHVILEEATPLAQRTKLAFIGPGVVVSDDPTNDETRVVVSGAEVTSAAFSRQSTEYTTAVLAQADDEVGLISLPLGYRLLTITTSRPARVRVYENATKRDADRLRTRVEPVLANSGLMLDYVTVTGSLSATLSPLVDGFAQTADSAAITVENLGSAGTVTTTFTYLRTE